MFGTVIFAVRDAIRISETGLANPASCHQFCISTSSDGINEISPAPPRVIALVRACPGLPSECSTCSSDAPADHSPEVWVFAPGVGPSLALSEHGPCFVGGIIPLDDASFTTKITVHSGANTFAPFGCVALLDTGSPQTLIRRNVLDRMLSVGAASTARERKSASRSWGGVGEFAPLQTLTSVRLRLDFFRAEELRRSLAVWSCVVRPSVIHFTNCSYRSLSPRPSDHRIFGELDLSQNDPAGVPAYAIDPVASGVGFHLRYDGAEGVSLPDEPQLLAVNLVRSNGSQAITGKFLVDMLPQSDLPSVVECFAASRRQVIPLVGVADLEPGDILGVAHAPLMCVSLDVLQHDSRAPGLSSGPPAVTPISAVTASPLAIAAVTASPSPALLERLAPEQCALFLRIWERLPSHPRAVVFDLYGRDWTSLAIEQLGDFICDSANVFSKSKPDFCSFSLMLFEISAPQGSAPVTSRPQRINPILAKEVDATLNRYLAAGLIQHSTSP